MTTPADFEPSYYEASVTRPPAKVVVAGELTAEVCVIGGGLTGLSCALELAKAGRDVVVLESKRVGWGASGRSGGQVIQGYSTDNLADVAKQGGVDEKRLFDFSLEALGLVKERISTYDIACDFQQGHAHAATKPSHYNELCEWTEKATTAYDYPHLTTMDAIRFREIVASRRYHGGVIDTNSGHLHPLKYTLGLCQAAIAAGTRVFENSPVQKIIHGDKISVQTAAGVVRCRQIVLACNAYDRNLFPRIAARVMPVGTYIGATPPLGGDADALIADNLAVTDTNFVLDYYRCSADKRLLFGGRVSYSTQPPINLPKAVYQRMVRVFPQLSHLRFDFVWGGYVAITINRFPDIGREQNNVYYAQGFSGHGVALTGFAGKIIAEAIMGDEEKFDVFDRIKHRPFPGGQALRMPLLILAMLYYRLRDLL